MKRVRAFVDTNVLVDLLAGDRPCSSFAKQLFQAAKDGLIELFLTTQSFLDAAYISMKTYKVRESHFSMVARSLMSFVNVGYIDSFELRDALWGESEDIEDAAQYAHADSLGCDVIVTSDRRFASQRSLIGGMEILSPEECIDRMK